MQLSERGPTVYTEITGLKERRYLIIASVDDQFLMNTNCLVYWKIGKYQWWNLFATKDALVGTLIREGSYCFWFSNIGNRKYLEEVNFSLQLWSLSHTCWWIVRVWLFLREINLENIVDFLTYCFLLFWTLQRYIHSNSVTVQFHNSSAERYTTKYQI